MEIQDIKARLPITTVLNHYNITLDKHNKTRCPFHAEKTASFTVYHQTNTFNCFGCGASGDTIEFIQLKEKSNKHDAIVKAQSLISGVAETVAVVTTEKTINENSRLASQNRIAILSKIFESFKNGLHHPISIKPKAYLTSRNLNYEILETGYNSGQFHHHGKLSEADQNACIQAGLLIPYNGKTPNASGTSYSPFAKDCIIFPLKDKNGNIVSLYGRSIIDNDNAKHYYLKDRCGLYPCYPKKTTIKLILTEAIIDAATLVQYQLIHSQYTVLAGYGTNGLTDEHLQAIGELQQLDELILFFDGDKAGREAIERNSSKIQTVRPEIHISYVETPEGEDINSLLQGHESAILLHLIENRKPLFLLSENKNSITQSPITKTEPTENHPAQTSTASTQQVINTRNPDYITYSTKQLHITILGGINLEQLDRLRVTLKISRTDTGSPLHSIRHTVDLYHSDYLEKFIIKTSEQLEIGTNTIKHTLAELTQQLENYRLGKHESRKEQKPQSRQLSQEQKQRAVAYLKAPNLMQRTNHDIGKTGVIGEETNRLLMYLIFTSRKREQPLHIVSLGASGTGKTHLQEKISELIPEQDKLEITILTENAFYYFDRKELKHKLVLIEDMDGAQDVLYPLRELQSKRHISKTVPVKDNKGNLKTITLHVEGPICLAGTTTKEKLYEDNANRSVLIYLDNSSRHKEEIMDYQRKVSAGKINSRLEHQQKEYFKDMQSMLQPIKVRNPFAEQLKLPEYVFKPLRTNVHYLIAIETITFYHQYQRQQKTDPVTNESYIETTIEDIEWANILLKDILLAKSDELTGENRAFFESLKTWCKTQKITSFYSSQIREAFRMNPNNLKYYLIQLVRYGYIKTVGGDRYKRGYEYEIVNFEEYQKLNTGISNVLDEVLQNIKKTIRG